MSKAKGMWRCQVANCGYVYDPDQGDPKYGTNKGTSFNDLPEDWRCPYCGASKKSFRSLADVDGRP